MKLTAFTFSPLVHFSKTHLPRLCPRVVGRTWTAQSSSSSLTAEATGTTAVDADRVRHDMIESAMAVAHFNSAGDSPMPRAVLERVTSHLMSEATLGGYEAAARCQEELESVYESAARLINAKPDEIALQESASMAWARAFYATAPSLRPGDRILTGVAEYAANYVAMLQVCKRTGAVVQVIPSDDSGILDVDALRSMLSAGDVKIVAITHVPSNGGMINPAKEVGDLCREYGVLYILDSCQSVGQLHVDVNEIGCDVLCATGRKFLRGPRGTGFLFISREAMNAIGEPPMIDHYAAPWAAAQDYELRSDARRFEFWESNIAGRLGLGVALRYAMEIGMRPIEDRVRSLGASLRVKLADIPGVTVADLGTVEHQCGIVSFTVSGINAEVVKQGLRAAKVYVSTSGPGSTPLDAADRSLPTVVRASVHYFNNQDDLERLVVALRGIIERPPDDGAFGCQQ